MSKDELRVLCELKMVLDPWPLDEADNNIFTVMLDRECRKQGFDDWIEAWHELG